MSSLPVKRFSGVPSFWIFATTWHVREVYLLAVSPHPTLPDFIRSCSPFRFYLSLILQPYLAEYFLPRVSASNSISIKVFGSTNQINSNERPSLNSNPFVDEHIWLTTHLCTLIEVYVSILVNEISYFISIITITGFKFQTHPLISAPSPL